MKRATSIQYFIFIECWYWKSRFPSSFYRIKWRAVTPLWLLIALRLYVLRYRGASNFCSPNHRAHQQQGRDEETEMFRALCARTCVLVATPGRTLFYLPTLKADPRELFILVIARVACRTDISLTANNTAESRDSAIHIEAYVLTYTLRWCTYVVTNSII